MTAAFSIDVQCIQCPRALLAFAGYVHTIRSGLFTRETQQITPAHDSLLTMPYGAKHCIMPRTGVSAHGSSFTFDTFLRCGGDLPYARFATQTVHHQPESAHMRFIPSRAVLHHLQHYKVICSISVRVCRGPLHGPSRHFALDLGN